MKRRNFLKNVSIAGAGSLIFNGLPIQSLGATGELQRILAGGNSDRVLVLIQMHGGNDGLNTVIPINHYNLYKIFRPNLAIPDTGLRKYIDLDKTLPTANQVGLHPDMKGVKSLYDQGKAAIVQGVSYENMNQSHFRSRDIFFMGGDYDDYIGSGWMGRYLDKKYPNYPDSYPNEEMQDPLAIEIGRGVSLAFHRDEGIPASLSLQNPQQFYDLISNVGGETSFATENSFYGEELKYIMQMEQKSNEYAGRLKEVYDKGANSNEVYPEVYPGIVPGRYVNNVLASQLKLISRLLSGGVKTRIFLARIGGFDTHASQVTENDATVGSHAALLYHISTAMEAFQNDLKKLGLEDRVLSMTFSEFGRRVNSNVSYGTDHGKAAPMMLFGKHVKAGVIGTNPDLSDLDNGNLKMQHDYRQVFTTVLQDWMCATDDELADSRFSDFIDKKLDLIDANANATSEKSESKVRLNSCYPNPVEEKTTFSFWLKNKEEINIKIFSTNGLLVHEVLNTDSFSGDNELLVDLSHLSGGDYIYTFTTESGFIKSKTLVKL